MDIRSAIQHLSGTKTTPIIIGTIIRADNNTVDIQPLDDTAAPLLDIDLHIGDVGAITYRPDVGATVLVALDTPSTGFILLSSQCPIIINGGHHGGVLKTPELIAQLEKMSGRIDGIIEAIKSGVPTPQDGGTALQKTITASLDTITDVEDFSNIADDNVTH